MKRYVPLLCVLLACTKDNNTSNTPVLQGNEEIVFLSQRVPNDATWLLFVMNSDGSNQRQLTDDHLTCSPPVASNNGDHIAYTSYDPNEYKLWVVDKDGGNKSLLYNSNADHSGDIAWSPDDKSLAFVVSTLYGSDIYLINLTTRDQRKLTNGGYNYCPEFLDNETILYSSYNDNFSGIYSTKTDGSHAHLLSPRGKSFGHPKISPDRRKIAVTSGDVNQVWVMNIEGTNARQLTSSVSPVSFPGAPRDGNNNPVWSPDSKKIAYVTYAANGSPDICVMNANGTMKKTLTNDRLRDESPTWTSDGKYILFSSNRDLSVGSEIYSMTANGSDQQPLTKYPTSDVYPVILK
jgi:TolB protein